MSGPDTPKAHNATRKSLFFPSPTQVTFQGFINAHAEQGLFMSWYEHPSGTLQQRWYAQKSPGTPNRTIPDAPIVANVVGDLAFSIYHKTPGQNDWDDSRTTSIGPYREGGNWRWQVGSEDGTDDDFNDLVVVVVWNAPAIQP